MIKQVDVMPTEGQFVAVWVAGENGIFSDTMRNINGDLYMYDVDNDDFIPPCDHGIDSEFLSSFGAVFFVEEK